MAEYSNTVVQTVAAGASVLFTERAKCGCSCGISHRDGSGLFTLRGKGTYRVTFGGNIAVPTGGTVAPISVAIAVEGEALYSSIATSTPGALNAYNNVGSQATVCVPCDCCMSVSVKNISTQAINVANPNLIIERIG